MTKTGLIDKLYGAGRTMIPALAAGLIGGFTTVRRFYETGSHRLSLFASAESPIFSLETLAGIPPVDPPQRGQWNLLVRHFLDRFFHNDLISTDGETQALVIQSISAVAIPGLIVALYLFFPYHPFLPTMTKRPFWSQVSDHYFYVMYSFTVMGGVTVFEWEMLFPDRLDVFVLSVLPIAKRTLFSAKVSALVFFLVLFLVGADALGIICLPVVSDLPSFSRHIAAHSIAVIASGVFAAGFCITAQGLLLNLAGAWFFRAAAPFLQGLFATALLMILFLCPLISGSMRVLVHSAARHYFPPFWFLGIYERLLMGKQALAVFSDLAREGLWATSLVVALAIITYPLAYKRRTRQVIEGSKAASGTEREAQPISDLLHGTLFRTPSKRAIYHFICETLFQTQRHRVYLAMYAALGAALIVADAMVFKLGYGRIRLGVSSNGLRMAIPILVFWMVAGLRNAFAAPIDPPSDWIFRVIHGGPRLDHLLAARDWVLLWTTIVTLGAVALFWAIAPAELHSARIAVGQLLVGLGLSLLLTDIFFRGFKSIPFTELRPSGRTHLAFLLLLYCGLFPPLVLITLDLEPWIEASRDHLAASALVVLVAHLAMRLRYRRRMGNEAAIVDIEGDDGSLLRLALRDG